MVCPQLRVQPFKLEIVLHVLTIQLRRHRDSEMCKVQREVSLHLVKKSDPSKAMLAGKWGE